MELLGGKRVSHCRCHILGVVAKVLELGCVAIIIDWFLS